ncbi:MAG: RNA polymerase sigma factor, partial [Mycobacteriales bacterium]
TSLVAQMRPALVKYFKRKTGNIAEAEDLAHDVLTRALTHARWISQDQAKGYIFRAAVNRWRDRHRRVRTRGVTVPWDEAAEAQSATHGSPERVLIVNEELNQIAQALEELSVRTRTVMMLIRLEQMKVATVAEMLGISVSAVNKHLSKGIAHLALVRKRQDAVP